MRFCCEHCGRQLSVADGQTGRKGRCPRCKNTVTIPTAPVRSAAVQATRSDDALAATKPTPRDPLLLDVPPADVTPGKAAPESLTREEAYERLRAMQDDYVLKAREKPPDRPLPWIVDIFLYPMNKPGMLILSLSVGIPLLLQILVTLGQALLFVFPPAVILWVPCLIAHWAALLLFVLYVAWYATECIRDSAAGAIRAADTTGLTPGLSELFGQALTLVACGAACMVPAVLYAAGRGDAGRNFWILYGTGGFLFPMALLAVVMFESLRALNPVLLLGSILSTFLPYCALAVFCCMQWLLLPLALYYVRKVWVVGYLLLFLAFYQLLIQAHLLGRFYWKNQEKLNWDT